MSRTVRCPSCNGFGRLAFDGYYACDECRVYLHSDAFRIWLKEIDLRLLVQRDGIRDILSSKEMQ